MNALSHAEKAKPMSRKKASDTMRLQAPWWDKDVLDKDGKIINEGEFVRVRKYTNHGIDRAVQASMAEFIDAKEIDVSQSEGNATPNIKLNLNMQALIKKGNDTQLLLMLCEWNFRREDGNILPLTQEGLDEVHDEDIEYILGEIEKVNPQPITKEQREAFLQTQTSGTTTSTPNETQPLAG